MGPVMEGYITYADLKNGGLNLFDLYKIHEMMSYKAAKEREARRKYLAEMKKKKGS